MLPAERTQNLESGIFEWFRDEGNREMAVDGSAGMKQYFVDLTAFKCERLKIVNVQLNISGGKIDDPEMFGGMANALTNGFQVGFIEKNGDVFDEETYLLAYNNYDLINNSSSSKPWGFSKDARDVMIVKFFEDFDLEIDTRKYPAIFATVRDDLSSNHSIMMSLRAHTA